MKYVIKNYVFDLGMVLFDYNPEYMTKLYAPTPEDCVLLESVVFSRRYWGELDKGTLSDSEFKAAVHKELPPRLHAVADAIYDNWVNNLLPIDGMDEIISIIKDKHAKLYLLSNISIYFSEKYSSVPHVNEMLSRFDGLVFSGPIHKVKPNDDIFNYLTEKYSLAANECLFIDDKPDNISAAKRLGFQTYRFDGNVSKLKDYIERLED